MSILTCSACIHYEPREANHLHGDGYGICRHPRRACPDYSVHPVITLAPIAHNADPICVRFDAINPEPQQLPLMQDDNLIRAMLHNSKTHEPVPSYYAEVSHEQ